MWLVGYLFGQQRRHGLPASPLWEGCSLLDTIGARWVRGYRPQFARVLPRLRMPAIYELGAIPGGVLAPFSDHEIAGLGLSRLVSATAATFAPAQGRRRSTQNLLARRAVARLGAATDARRRDIAALLAMTPRSIHNLARGNIADGALLSVRTRLALEERLRASGQPGLAA